MMNDEQNRKCTVLPK